MIQFIKNLIPMYRQIRDLYDTQARLGSRLLTLEEGRHNRRSMAVYDLVDYLMGAQVPGDYCEFGVYRGDTFSYAYRLLSELHPEMRFFAFDSFEGLPQPKGPDALNGYTSNFHENEFSCREEEFVANLKKNKVDLNKVKTVKGWFEQTLTEDKAETYGIQKIAAAWVDCDLYESTVPVLNFILQYLSVGSVIVFDDWRCFRNLPDFGEQRACHEWLTRNPQLRLNQLFSFGFHGVAFTVGSC